MYIKSKKELNYERSVDPNVLCAARLVHSDLRIYRILFFPLDINLKSVLPQCCVNKVSYSFSSHISPCYHSAVAITFLTVFIHLKSLLPQCCVNKVSYSFSSHISPCYHSAVAITFVTVSIHLKSLLPHCCGNKVSYSFLHI